MRSGEEDEDFIWFHGFKTERKKNNNRMKVKRNNTVIVAVCALMKS